MIYTIWRLRQLPRPSCSVQSRCKLDEEGGKWMAKHQIQIQRNSERNSRESDFVVTWTTEHSSQAHPSLFSAGAWVCQPHQEGYRSSNVSWAERMSYSMESPTWFGIMIWICSEISRKGPEPSRCNGRRKFFRDEPEKHCTYLLSRPSSESLTRWKNVG